MSVARQTPIWPFPCNPFPAPLMDRGVQLQALHRCRGLAPPAAMCRARLDAAAGPPAVRATASAAAQGVTDAHVSLLLSHGFLARHTASADSYLFGMPQAGAAVRSVAGAALAVGWAEVVAGHMVGRPGSRPAHAQLLQHVLDLSDGARVPAPAAQLLLPAHALC